MRPWRKGEDAVLPDEMVTRLLKEGAVDNPRPFPPPDVVPSVPVSNSPAEPPRPKRLFLNRKRG